MDNIFYLAFSPSHHKLFPYSPKLKYCKKKNGNAHFKCEKKPLAYHWKVFTLIRWSSNTIFNIYTSPDILYLAYMACYVWMEEYTEHFLWEFKEKHDDSWHQTMDAPENCNFTLSKFYFRNVSFVEKLSWKRNYSHNKFYRLLTCSNPSLHSTGLQNEKHQDMKFKLLLSESAI